MSLGQVAGRRGPLGPRLGTFPLVSGDAFAHACDHLPFGRPFGGTAPAAGRTWFVELSDLEQGRHRDSLLESAARCDDRPTLVLHNGDLLPPATFFEQALEVFDRVFSVNVVAERSRIAGIPIGLENPWHRRPEESGQFLPGRWHVDGFDADSARRETFFASFRVVTNPTVRVDLERRLQRLGVPNRSIDRAAYRAMIRRSRFVISPPGNGPDCHRTWEALYLGAVPVVLRSALAPSITAGSRIMAVDEWDELFSLSTAELEQTFLEYSSRPMAPSLMPHWLHAIGAGSV